MNTLRIFLFLSIFSTTATAQVKVNVIDTGPGLATVISLPDNNFIVYDTGHWLQIGTVTNSIEEILPDDAIIDILVLSHTDSDHIAATEALLNKYFVNQVIRTGLERASGTWKRTDAAIRNKANDGELFDFNLADYDLLPGSSYLYGDAMVTFLAGFQKPPAQWDIRGSSEFNNAGSIVMRVAYKDKSILIMGDAVGRHLDAPDDQLIATEKFLVDNSHSLTIDSDVLIASHHGADNGSATAFIEAVTPEWVIFSAGHDHEHPRQTAADRFITAGVDVNKMLRTDLGDHEDNENEWDRGRIPNNSDQAGDDDIEIIISEDGILSVSQNNQ